jgi:hypothetical protein
VDGSETTTFESLNYPGRYIRHIDSTGVVRIDLSDGSNSFSQDASWFARVGKVTDVNTISLTFISD